MKVTFLNESSVVSNLYSNEKLEQILAKKYHMRNARWTKETFDLFLTDDKPGLFFVVDPNDFVKIVTFCHSSSSIGEENSVVSIAFRKSLSPGRKGLVLKTYLFSKNHIKSANEVRSVILKASRCTQLDTFLKQAASVLDKTSTYPDFVNYMQKLKNLGKI